MSLTTSTPAQILNSPLNTSKSKMQFSFPKSRRMPDLKSSSCANAFYELPSVRANRSTGFGYGNKYDFTKNGPHSPAPNAYFLKNEFKPVNKIGKTFGLSREALKTSGSFFQEKNSPGPAAYDVRETLKVKLSYTFRPRTSASPDAGTAIKNPGPGAYEPPSAISNKGKYFVSKYKSSGALTFNPTSSKRFADSKAGDKPGPGAYQSSVGFSKSGTYFVTGFKSSMGRTFGTSFRKTQFQTVSTPGPGSYRLPSDFGYYESARARTSHNNRSSVSLAAKNESRVEPKTESRVEPKPETKPETKIEIKAEGL